MFTNDIAARVTRGDILPGESQPLEPANVLFIDTENDPEDTLVPRLMAARAVLSRVRILRTVNGSAIFNITQHLSLLESGYLEEFQPALIVIDPIQAHVGKETNTDKANKLRAAMVPLVLLAERYKFALVLVMHPNKNSEQKILYRILDSIDYAALARSVLLVGPHPENPEWKILVPAKANNAKLAQSWEFQTVSAQVTLEDQPPMEVGKVVWGESPSSITSEDMESAERGTAEDRFLIEGLLPIEWVKK